MEEICLYIGLLGAFAELVDCFRVACGSYALKLRIACKKLKDLCPLLYGKLHRLPKCCV
jgi:hypothetical protein